jgi:hypothetical protein
MKARRCISAPPLSIGRALGATATAEPSDGNGYVADARLAAMTVGIRLIAAARTGVDERQLRRRKGAFGVVACPWCRCGACPNNPQNAGPMNEQSLETAAVPCKCQGWAAAVEPGGVSDGGQA